MPEDVIRRQAAFQEGVARRSAERVVETPGGFAVLDDRYPVSYENNQLFVTGPVAAEVVLAEAERVLSERQHRCVTVLDAAVGVGLAPALGVAGYRHDHLVVMVLSGPAGAAAPGIEVERAALEAIRAADASAWDERYTDLTADDKRQLFERRQVTPATRAATSCSWSPTATTGRATSTRESASPSRPSVGRLD